VAAAILPLAIWEFVDLSAALIMLGGSLPLLMSVAGAGSPVNVAVSDLLLAFLAAGIAAAAVVGDGVGALRALRPARGALGPYGALIILLLPIHFGLHEVLQTAQRFELFLIPAVVGAYAVLTKRHLGVLTAYLLATTVFAAVWPADNMGIQKNPAGQLITNAILLLLAFKPVRRLLPCLLVLMPGLFLTQSRGAVVALVVGLAVLALFHPSRGRTILTRVLPLVVIGLIAFTQLSTAEQQRLTSFSSGTETRAQYAVKIRHEYAHDAKRVIAAHPWAGVGVGNYLISSSVGASTTDPHEVVLLEAAEGGYGFAAAFIVLILGSSVLLYRFRRLDLAPAAAAIMLATFTHGLVDVYWVRGTPVLSWLVLGMVCGMYAQHRNTEIAT
jgi:membrane-bound metal-dependent hydrolase YbcI (DUF457 family)